MFHQQTYVKRRGPVAMYYHGVVQYQSQTRHGSLCLLVYC